MAVSDYMTWWFQVAFLLIGMSAGVLLTLLLTPVAFRLQRRRALRRDWKANRPGQVEEGLYPEWQEYDPEIPGIARKCVCHSRKIHPGEHVLTWPETGPMALLHVAVYCESVKEKLDVQNA